MEVERLGWVSMNVVPGGIGQGAAVGRWTLPCRTRATSRVAEFLAASCWHSLAVDVERGAGAVCNADALESSPVSESPETSPSAESMIAVMKQSLLKYGGSQVLPSTPAFQVLASTMHMSMFDWDVRLEIFWRR